VDATTIISAVGLFFAAVAAWGAWMTVRLTRQLQSDARRRRAIEAVLGVQYAAEDLRDHPMSAEKKERFVDAQRELERAGIQSFVGIGTIEELRALPGLFGTLTGNDAMIEPGNVAENAKRVLRNLPGKPTPTRMQRFWSKIQWAGMYVRHPLNRKSVNELRRLGKEDE
jgi:hypothetical protein